MAQVELERPLGMMRAFLAFALSLARNPRLLNVGLARVRSMASTLLSIFLASSS
jgi:hypothetical protein